MSASRVPLRDDRYRRADYYHFLEASFAESVYGFPATQPGAHYTADDNSEWEYGDGVWEKMSYAPARWQIRKLNWFWYILNDQDGMSIECHYTWREALDRIPSLSRSVR